MFMLGLVLYLIGRTWSSWLEADNYFHPHMPAAEAAQGLGFLIMLVTFCVSFLESM